MTQRNRCAIVLFAGLVSFLNFHQTNAVWLDIKPMVVGSQDKLHIHHSDDYLSPLLMPTGSTGDTLEVLSMQSQPPQRPIPSTATTIIHHRFGVAIGNISPLTPTTTVAPIRYEDLEHLLDAGFEKDLEIFYEQHKHELDESTRRVDIDGGGVSDDDIVTSNSSTHLNGLLASSTSKPPKVYYLPDDNDPWSHYDKVMLAQQQLLQQQHHQTATTTTNPPSIPTVNVDDNYDDGPTTELQTTTNVAVEETPSKAATDADAETVTSVPSKKRFVKLVPVRIVALPEDPMSSVPKSSFAGFAGFVSFLRNIQNSIVSSTTRNIQDKVQMLKSFRDSMLRQIKRQIQSLWPSARPKRITSNRMKRSHDSGGHTLDFPSSEGALMTLSFLTFAVFLIKLVLQVINTIKSKHYNYNTTLETGANTITALNVIKRNRNARWASLNDRANDSDDVLVPGGMRVAQVLAAVDGLKN